ncbi:MAG: hypothetical protein MK213_10085 [Planctomycetes bacterium]|nr:hypothetical protein [Planctomycetota bacterium]
MRLPLLLSLTLGLSVPALAQTQYTMDIDSPSSAMNWNGSTSLGTLKGNKNLNATGTTTVMVSNASSPFGTGEFTGGHMGTIPVEIYAYVDNPIPFLPPLAKIWIRNLDIGAYSPPFSIDATTGNFATNMSGYLHDGEVEVQALGTTLILPLAGTWADPYPVNGSVTETGGKINGHLPVNVSISDSAGGISFDFSMTGDVYASADISTTNMVVSSGTLTAGQNGLIDVVGGNPNVPTYLVYSLRGLGSTPINALGIVLDILSPKLAATATSDANGDVSWTQFIPNGTTGVTVWIQACQMGLKSTNVEQEVIQ